MPLRESYNRMARTATRHLGNSNVAPETRLHDLHPSQKFAPANTVQRQQLTGSSAALKCISQTRLAIELLIGKFISGADDTTHDTTTRTYNIRDNAIKHYATRNFRV